MVEGLRSIVEKGVLKIQIDRPERKNALTHKLYNGLADLILKADADGEIKTVLLYGHEEIFCAGNDIGDFTRGAPEGERPSTRFMKTVVDLRKPLVAAVNGPAVGIGATMLLHCDLVYAGSNASISFPFVKLGLCPEFASSLLLARRVGMRRAAELLLLAEPCSAVQALEYGLVNAVSQPALTLQSATAAAEKLAQSSQESVMATRRLLRHASTTEILSRVEEENEEFGRLLQTPAVQAAFAAFMGKQSS